MPELSADERAVLLTLTFQRRVLPAWLQTAEAWHAKGRPPAPAADQPGANQPAAAQTWNRVERLKPALLAANTRINELTSEGAVVAIVGRLTAWGLWHEPEPPAPNTATILERLGRVFPDEAN